jgi:hypothetical protein
LKTVTDAIGGLDAKPRQLARLRQAWEALRQAYAEQELVKKRGVEDTDLEGLLSSGILDDLNTRFWKRYHTRIATELEPSDFLISRLSKELAKRLLQVHPVYKVKTLTHQLRAERKRQKIGAGLEFVHSEALAGDEPSHTVTNYLNCLFTLSGHGKGRMC